MPSESETACQDVFSCKQCGDCCKGYGGTYVSDADIEAISAYIGVTPEHFKVKYCCLSGERLLLVQQENGFCVFWRGKMCGIHPVKPKMCRDWPFISNLLVDPSNWEKMASMCPGIRKDAPTEDVQDCVRAFHRK